MYKMPRYRREDRAVHFEVKEVDELKKYRSLGGIVRFHQDNTAFELNSINHAK